MLEPIIANGASVHRRNVAWTYKLSLLLCVPTFILYIGLGLWMLVWVSLTIDYLAKILSAILSIAVSMGAYRRYSKINRKFKIAERESQAASYSIEILPRDEPTILTNPWIGAAFIPLAMALPVLFVVALTVFINLKIAAAETGTGGYWLGAADILTCCSYYTIPAIAYFYVARKRANDLEKAALLLQDQANQKIIEKIDSVQVQENGD